MNAIWILTATEKDLGFITARNYVNKSVSEKRSRGPNGRIVCAEFSQIDVWSNFNSVAKRVRHRGGRPPARGMATDGQWVHRDEGRGRPEEAREGAAPACGRLLCQVESLHAGPRDLRLYTRHYFAAVQAGERRTAPGPGSLGKRGGRSLLLARSHLPYRFWIPALSQTSWCCSTSQRVSGY